MAPSELKSLGRYALERVLGKGAMGVVYEGFDPRLNRRVAIKTILKSHLDEDTGKDFAMRFVREAQAVARLNHPNIVQVHDFGEEGDIAYLVMEFIRGKELKSFFDANRRFDLKEVVRIMSELCDALDFAHTAGIIHRDIKPGNVMLDAQMRTKLTDFGVARVQDVTRSQATEAGTMVGTPAYMSPEQIAGGAIDRRTDVFSAGIILYQFLTGSMPFTGGGAWTIAKKIMQDHPALPSSIDASVTPLFDVVVSKALAKNPEQRYKSARDLGIALKRALEGAATEDNYDRTVIRPEPLAAGAALPAGAATRSDTQEAEVEFWRSIKDGNDPDDFELYVQQFPTGIYAALAKRKIAKLRGVALDDSSAKAKEQERKEQEEAARRESEVESKLEAERARLEAEMARKEEEYKKRQAAAEARQLAAEQARVGAEEKARREAMEKAKQEADAEFAKREAEYRKREAEAETKRIAAEKAWAEAEERARREALEKAKQEATAELAKREAEYRKREAEAEEKRQVEAKARADAEAKAKTEAEAKAKLEIAAEFAKREVEYKKREAEAETKRIAAENARAEAEERARREALEKAKQEAAAELAKREVEYRKRAADAEAKREAAERARAEAEARAKTEAESKAKAGAEAEMRAGAETEAKAKREAEFAKREAQLKKRLAEAEKTMPPGARKKNSPVVPVVIGVLLAAIGGSAWYALEQKATNEKALAERVTRDKAAALAAEKAAVEKAAQEKSVAAKLAADRGAAERAAAEQKAAAERAASARAAAAKFAEEKAAQERAQWDAIKTSSNPSDFDRFLAVHPSGYYVDLARSAKAKLMSDLKVREQHQRALDAEKAKIEEERRLHQAKIEEERRLHQARIEEERRRMKQEEERLQSEARERNEALAKEKREMDKGKPRIFVPPTF